MTNLSSLLASPSRRRWMVAVLAVGLLLLAGCAESGQMIDQPRYDPYEASQFFADGSSARPFEPGTVPYYAEGSPNDPAVTGLDANDQPVKDIPVKVTQELVQRGQERFDIYCIPCHGATGEGNGRATTFGFPKPPNLLAASDLTNGQIFEIITNGRGKMFSYGYRVKPPDRWAIISYVRAMQLKQGAVKPSELTPEELNQLGTQP